MKMPYQISIDHAEQIRRSELSRSKQRPDTHVSPLDGEASQASASEGQYGALAGFFRVIRLIFSKS
jgi:hypothetical protein